MEIKSNSQNNQGIEGHINRKSTVANILSFDGKFLVDKIRSNALGKMLRTSGLGTICTGGSD